MIINIYNVIVLFLVRYSFELFFNSWEMWVGFFYLCLVFFMFLKVCRFRGLRGSVRVIE